MRVVPRRTSAVATILAAEAFGLLATNILHSSISTPRAGVVTGDPTVSPFAMMVKAPRNLPVEHYDAN